jgi:hypothetical protein
MTQASLVQEHMDVISCDRKMVGKVDHLDGRDKIKLTKQSSPTGEHHHFIPRTSLRTGSTKDESRFIAPRSGESGLF